MQTRPSVAPVLVWPKVSEERPRTTTFHARQEWEECVVAINGTEFTARLVDPTAGVSCEEEEAQILLEIEFPKWSLGHLPVHSRLSAKDPDNIPISVSTTPWGRAQVSTCLSALRAIEGSGQIELPARHTPGGTCVRQRRWAPVAPPCHTPPETLAAAVLTVARSAGHIHRTRGPPPGTKVMGRGYPTLANSVPVTNSAPDYVPSSSCDRRRRETGDRAAPQRCFRRPEHRFAASGEPSRSVAFRVRSSNELRT